MWRKLANVVRLHPKAFLYSFLLVCIPLSLSGLISGNVEFFRFLENPVTQWAFLFITIFTMALSLTPTVLVSLVAGFFYGWFIFPGLIVTYMCAAALGFFLGKKVKLSRLRDKMEEFPRADMLIRKLEHNDFWAIVFCRLSPMFPFALTNFLLASLRINFWRYMAANLVGMLPRTVLVFYAGMQAKVLSDLLEAPKEMGWAQWATPIFILVSLAGFFVLFSRSAKRFYAS